MRKKLAFGQKSRRGLCLLIISLLISTVSLAETAKYNQATREACITTRLKPDQPGTSKAVVPVRELAVIDEAVPDKSVLLRNLRPGVKAVTIASDKNGLTHLEAILSHYSHLSALHIISHAEDGVLLLGNSRITSSTLKNNPSIFSSLKSAMQPGGDLLLYGCNLAKGPSGRNLINLLHNKADVNVEASDNLTGATELGGDWKLEVNSGKIETASAITSQAQQSFSGLLVAPPPASETFDAFGFQYNNSTTSFVVNGWTFTAASNATFANFPHSPDPNAYDFQLNGDGGTGDYALAVNYDEQTITAYTFKSTDGSNFKLNSFDLQSMDANVWTSVTITVYSDGLSVGSATIDPTTSGTSNGITWTYGGTDPNNLGPYGTVSFNSTYQNVDEIHLDFNSPTYGIGAFAIDNIMISPAVTNAAPTV